MINYWWVTRPKRKLNSVPEVLSTFAEISLNQEWEGQRATHLAYESALEEAGLKRVGERRDQGGGGARTYRAWLMSLGLIFTQECSDKIKLTLAGEAIMKGDSPVEVITNQILKYQFPSVFSISRNVNVSPRFKIRPFRFLLKLLCDSQIQYLTEEEIAKVIVVEAENETDRCYKYIVNRILEFREKGDSCLETDFFDKYKPSRGEVNPEHPYSHLMDLANTLVNWLEYTQFVVREEGKLYILEEKREYIEKIVNENPPFIDRPEEQEFFQRKFGVDPKHRKDSRNLTVTQTVTAKILAHQKIVQAYITESLNRPITKITPQLIDTIVHKTGIKDQLVEEVLYQQYPNGSVSAFMTKYFEMAFKGREEATDFEKATVELFRDVFGYTTKHVGPIGLTPDVLCVSDSDGYQAIIDNKAYSKYSITNDHYNRMVYNYIKNISNYSSENKELGYFTYIAGGFGRNINEQIKNINNATGVNGSAISVTNLIKMVEMQNKKSYSHKRLREIFSLDRQILLTDL